MINWFYCWLHKKIERAVGQKQVNDNRACNAITLSAARDFESEKQLNFTMMLAEGGVVLQQTYYDEKTDRRKNKMYLIPEDQDVAQRVGEIVAMEILRI